MPRPVISDEPASCKNRLRRKLLHRRQLDQEVRPPAAVGLDGDVSAVLLDDAVRDRKPEAGSGADLLRREERVEDPLLELPRDPGARVRELDPDPVGVGGSADPDRLSARLRERVAGVREQVDEHLLELDRVAEDDQLVRREIERDFDPAQAQLLLHQQQRALDHVVDVHGLDADGRGATECAEVRDDRRRLPYLLHRVLELVDHIIRVERAEAHLLEDVADAQSDVVQRVVELVCDGGRELAEGRELARLHELLLLFPQLLLPVFHLLRRLTQVAHDVDHRFAAVSQTQVGLVRVLEDVQERAARVVEALRLAGEPAAVVLVVAEDVQHRLALVGELPVRHVEVAHDVEQRTAALLRQLDAAFEVRDPLAQCVRAEPGLAVAVAGRRDRKGVGLRSHQVLARSVFSLSFSRWTFSSSFSSAIIFSSRPTTTSSNFSRSRIFSWSSVLDSSRSRTTASYARMSLRTPIAPITFPSVSRRADAFRQVGITSPVAARGFRTAFLVTPRSTTSRRAAVNSRVSSSLMKRESDCSTTSSRRKPRSSETASLASRILPSRSETNTGSGAFLISDSA